MLYGADTAYCEEFRDLRRVDLGIFGIGAYDPWITGHANPEQAWTMANHAGAQRILPMHHSTFRLSHEPLNEPLERFMQAAARDPHRLVATQIGQVWLPDQ